MARCDHSRQGWAHAPSGGNGSPDEAGGMDFGCKAYRSACPTADTPRHVYKRPPPSFQFHLEGIAYEARVAYKSTAKFALIKNASSVCTNRG